jgi:tryptophan synthase alpha chain
VIEARDGVAAIEGAFARAKAEGRGALMPYVMAGDPDCATTEAVLAAVLGAGADIVELGIPYGDPLADGPTIAASAQRALDAGTTIDAALATIAPARALAKSTAPIVVFSYVNPIVQYGLDRFADALVGAGVSGAIVPDVPVEENRMLRQAFAKRGLALPLLIAPTTPPARAALIARASQGFIYVVSRLGVTGARREPDFAWIAATVERLREVTSTPLAVGFGIATPDHVARVLASADGAIVASALIDAIAGMRLHAAADRTTTFVRALAAATARA